MNPCNAIIKNWDIRVSEGYSGAIEIWIELSLQGGGCCVFAAYGVHTEDWHKNQFAYAVKRILEIVDVDSLAKIKGKPIRAKFAGNGGLGDSIIGIGNFLSEDWFMLSEEKLWKRE